MSKKHFKGNKKLYIMTEPTYTYTKSTAELLDDFYRAVVSNKEKPTSELIDSLVKNVYYKTDKEYIVNKIETIRRTHSVRKAEELLCIYNLAEALESKNEEEINKAKEALDKVEKEKERINKIPKNSYENMLCTKTYKTKEEYIKELKEDLEIIKSERRNPDHLYHEGKIKTSQFDRKFSIYLDGFTTDDYVDYLEAARKERPFTEEELKQTEEVLKYFTTNLALNLHKILALNPLTDEAEIRKFKVEGEEELKQMFTSSIDRLYDWKVKTISKRLQIYITLLTNTHNLLNDNFGSITQLQIRDKKALNEATPYLFEDYQNMVDISKTYYKRVKDVNYKEDSKKVELEDKYKKRMVLR